MILFWVICALLIVIALAFVLPPLLQKGSRGETLSDQERRDANIAIYRDQLSELETDLQNGLIEQQQYVQDREEIERRLLEDISATNNGKGKSTPAGTGHYSTIYLLALGIPLIAVSFYLKVGDLKAIGRIPTQSATSAATEQMGDRSQAQIEANVAALAKRLESNPADGEGWLMLARSYSSMERYSDAASAYERAAKVKPDDADLLAEYAFATAMSTNRQLQGKPQELINQALKVDPNNLKALELAGSAAFQGRQYEKAIDYWQRVVNKVPANSEVAQSVNSRIDEAKSLLKTR
jgi:cytochrome c-type biogenesis protein CcmH